MTTYTTSRYPGYSTETTTYFHGTCKIYSPVTQAEEDARGNYCTCIGKYDHARGPVNPDCQSMAGHSHEERVTCKHRHTSPDIAQECGRRLAERECRRRNRSLEGQEAR